MGRLSIEEELEQVDREINFSAALREKIGHHVYGELWAIRIKSFLHKKNWLGRPIHIISSNPHSVMNCLYSFAALADMREGQDLEDLAKELSHASRREWRQAVEEYAANHGMYQLDDKSGTNIAVQLFDTTQIVPASLPPEIKWDNNYIQGQKPIILVMDYAFGEQAYEAMDELLKPYEVDGRKIPLKVQSISVMGKAGILEGKKGDIMIPHSHVFEGTADNYPFDNDLTIDDFAGHDLGVYAGSMISVLGTSLQNKDILHYFLKSSWKAVGLEMEGAHYQKAIQAAAKIRRSIHPDVVLRYAYYASDNPLESGQTLASGSLGVDGVKPTYLITVEILNQILSPE